MLNPQLKTFLTVTQEGSFSAAGEKLYISATAVNQQITSLENGLGVRLFNRSRQGLTLTNAGKYLLSELPNIIERCEQVKAGLRYLQESNENTITVGIPHMHKIRLFHQYWSEYTFREPSCKVQLVAPKSWEKDDVFECYSNAHIVEYIDIRAAWQRNREFLTLENIKVGFFMPKNHPLASEKLITLDMLKGYEIVVSHGAFIDTIADYIDVLSDYGAKVIWQEWYTAEMMDSCYLNSQLTLGLMTGRSIHPGFDLVDIDWDASVPYGFSISGTPHKALQDFVDFVKSEMKQQTE